MLETWPKKNDWARLPTPVHKLEKFSTATGLNLWIKRDDQTGFEWSGNKIRKLEYLVRDALDKNATCLITCGGIQSNHCRATAALAAKVGMRCVLFLRGEKPHTSISNHLLDQIFGAEIFYLTNEQYYEGMGEMRRLVDEQIRAQGGKTYFIPEGGSNALGTFGYASAFQEIQAQLGKEGVPERFDSIVVAHGSGGTQAGLILGKIIAKDEQTKIVGVNVCYDAKESFRLVKDILWQAIQHQKLPYSFLAEDIQILDGYVGKGYAQSTPAELEFYLRVARGEGVLLDPVYTGKAFYALHETALKNKSYLGENVLFIHTGGGFGAFKAQAEWAEVLA